LLRVLRCTNLALQRVDESKHLTALSRVLTKVTANRNIIGWTAETQSLLSKTFLDPKQVTIDNIDVPMRVYFLGRFTEIALNNEEGAIAENQVLLKMLESIKRNLDDLKEHTLQDFLQLVQILNKILLDESTHHVHEVAKDLYKDVHKVIVDCAIANNEYFEVKFVMEYLKEISTVADLGLDKDTTSSLVSMLKQKCKE